MKYLLSLLFLLECPVCNQILCPTDLYVCPSCQPLILPLSGKLCSRCQIPLPPFLNKPCQHNPQKHLFFSRAFSLFAFEGAIQKIIHRIKFEKEHNLLQFFNPWLETLRLMLEKNRYDLIVSVPLHARRKRERGFNQSEMIGRKMSQILNVPQVCGQLIRTRFSSPQSTLSRRHRLTELNGAFQWRGPLLKHRRILLVDDVLTTGTTLNECAKVLRRAGAQRVDVLVLARTL
jgi:ComF family protein